MPERFKVVCIPCKALYKCSALLYFTPSRGVIPEGKKFLWANLQKIVEKRGRTGKKGVGRHLGGGDTRVKAIKSDSDSDSDEQKKGRQVFREKNRGVTPSVAAPGVAHPSDDTD